MDETGGIDKLRRRRRVSAVLILAALFAAFTVIRSWPTKTSTRPTSTSQVQTSPAIDALAKLAVKGRSPKTGYTRTQFSNGWAEVNGCDMRDQILTRDLTAVSLAEDKCKVLAGTLADPYTGHIINFRRGKTTSTAVEIDHVVAVSDAWQTGAQQLTYAQRHSLYNDPLELLAVDGPTNVKKGDGDAATWLPPNKDFRCRYVARQIAVKLKYSLWVTQAEHDAMARVLGDCPGQQLPAVQ